MATLYIEEYAALALDANGNVLPIVPIPISNQKVTIAGSSAQSVATSDKTKFVRLIADTACQYAIAADPTAVATSLFLPANVPVDRQITPGHEIAVIAQQ